MKRSRLRPGRKCPSCKGAGCAECGHRGFIIKPPKKRVRIAAQSPKRPSLTRQYAALRKQFLLKHPKCQVLQGPNRPCPNPATELHHRKGRGKWLLVEETFLAICNQCHRQIHGPLAAFAHRMGYMLNIASTQPVEPPSQIYLDHDTS